MSGVTDQKAVLVEVHGVHLAAASRGVLFNGGHLPAYPWQAAGKSGETVLWSRWWGLREKAKLPAFEINQESLTSPA